MSVSSTPVVTVFCIAYNHGKYIKDCLEGIVNQVADFKFEVIVHDDASSDETSKIIEEYQQKYPDIITAIIQKQNIGNAFIVTYDYMLPASHGKYIALCEGDDYWTDPNKLQIQYDYMEAHIDCSLCAHESLKYYVDEKTYTKFSDFDFSDSCNQNLTAAQIIMDHNYFHTSSMFFRKDYYINNKEFLKNHSMFDYTHKMLLATEGKVFVVPKVMSVYRRGTLGAWSNRIATDKDKLVKHIEVGIKIMKDINSYRNYIYDGEFEKGILSREFWREETLRHYKCLKQPPYLEIYQKLSVESKLRIFIECFLPFLYYPLQRIKHKIKHKKEK